MKKARFFLTILAAAGILCTASGSEDDLGLGERLAKAKQAAAAGDWEKVLELTDLESSVPPLVDLRVRAFQAAGVELFFSGQVTDAVESFDHYLEFRPADAPYHWQRGIALYYSGRFEQGAEQFRIHQEVNSHDVENAVFHFICQVPVKGWDESQAELIPIKGDQRVPMAEIHELFRGNGSPEEVIKAAENFPASAEEKRNHLCYAHYYLALYFEAKGEAELSLEHAQKAAHDYRMEHYMGRCAQLHFSLRSQD